MEHSDSNSKKEMWSNTGLPQETVTHDTKGQAEPVSWKSAAALFREPLLGPAGLGSD